MPITARLLRCGLRFFVRRISLYASADARPRLVSRLFLAFCLMSLFSSCTSIYGWNIHALGILSAEFSQDIPPAKHRVALFIPEGQKDFISKDKGTRLSDPQMYYIGEAFVPMLIES